MQTTLKLSDAAINALTNLISTAHGVGVDTLIIGQNLIRGIDEKKTVGIVSKTGAPDLDGKSIAINRVKQLVSRINLVAARGALQITCTLAANGTDISTIELSSGKSKSQFRCASVDAVKGVPKGFNDIPVWEVTVPATMIASLSQADSAMGGDGLTLASKDGKIVSVEFIDSNKDTCSIELDPEVVNLGSTSTSFAVKYWSKPFLGLLKEAAKFSDPKLLIGAGGLTQIEINGMLFFTLPQA